MTGVQSSIFRLSALRYYKLKFELLTPVGRVESTGVQSSILTGNLANDRGKLWGVGANRELFLH